MSLPLPAYSVVVPVKNEAACLPLLLTSLLAQTARPEAVIVADAASTDATRQIAEAFGAVVVEGGLPGIGRNNGARIVTTPWILFLDADVICEDPACIAQWLQAAVENASDLSVPHLFPFDGTYVDRLLYLAYNSYVRLIWHLKPHGAGVGLLVKRSLHERIVGFDETILFCEDHDYVIRASRVGKVDLHAQRLSTSVRRLHRDGRIGTAVRYFLAELHLWFLGPIRDDRFRYRFDHSAR